MGGAEDRLGAQAEILADPVHGVYDVIADLEVGEGDRNALFHRAELYALRRLPVDLAVAQHVQAQARNRESRLDVALIHEDHAAARHAACTADERGRPGFAQVQQRRATFDRKIGRAQHLAQARGAGGDQRDRFAGRDPGLDLIEKHRDLTVEMFDRPRLEHERFERARQPARALTFDCARNDQRAPRRKRRGERIEVGMRAFALGQQRLAARILVDAQLARLARREHHLFLARPFVFESAFDG